MYSMFATSQSIAALSKVATFEKDVMKGNFPTKILGNVGTSPTATFSSGFFEGTCLSCFSLSFNFGRLTGLT